MRRVLVPLLEPGMKVARAVYSSDGQLLINGGIELTRRMIDGLQRFNILALYIEDGLSADIEVSDVIRDETRLTAVKRVRSLMQQASAEHKDVGRTLVVAQEMAGTVEGIIDELFDSKDLVVNLSDIRMLNDYTFFHSVNVCVLCLMTGITLGLDRKVLLHLGLGALFHDIGKVFLDQKILNKPGALNPDEFEHVKQHTTLGYNLLRETTNISNLAALVALQHHERWGGTGYPQGLKGEEIHLLASVAGVCDTFDAITADRCYRPAFSTHEAYELVAASGDYLFDFKVVEAFLKNISAYPSGTLVLLSTGERGIVVDTPRGYGLYPNVRILIGPDGAPTSPYEVSLVEKRGVFVRDVLSEPQIKQLQERLGR